MDLERELRAFAGNRLRPRRDYHRGLALHERLTLAVLVAGTTCWIRLVEALPETRRRA
jgi:hypothetical protein